VSASIRDEPPAAKLFLANGTMGTQSTITQSTTKLARNETRRIAARTWPAAGIIAGAVILVAAELQAINPVVAFFRQQFQAAEHNRSGANSRIRRWRLPKPA